jgi:outer membrane receptor for ferrienterochelin and colicins
LGNKGTLNSDTKLMTMKKFMFFVEIITLLISGIGSSFGQTHLVQGTAFNSETNEPIGKIKISIKNTDISTITNENGKFILEVPDSIETISFSEFPGMELNEVHILRQNVYNIYLKNSPSYIYNLSLEELLQVKVVSASNVPEKLSEVPATMIVISEQDILERGYCSISEIFNDLPGMDITRHYGDQPVFNYWRGFRTAFSQPYLFMIDGMLCNDIFYNQPQIIDNIPLSNIENIEIVYGPVSAVYGANAFMGVINVITKKNTKDGMCSNARTRINNYGNFIGDIYSHYQKGKFGISISARSENTDLAQKLNLDDYYTNKNLLTDTLLWGDLAKSLNTDAKVTLPTSGKSLDFRLKYNNTELGFQVNSMMNSWGMGTPFDKCISNVMFSRNFYYLWFKQEFQLSEKLTTNITLHYRSEIREKGDWIEAYNYTNNSGKNLIILNDTIKPNQTARAIDYSLWPLNNEKVSFSQQFNFKISEKLLFTSGLEFDRTYITKQEGIYGNMFTPNNVSESNPDFYPKNGQKTFRPANRAVWLDHGIFSQIKYTLFDSHIINFGIRFDNNSEYGFSKTIRGGYIFNYNQFTIRLLYGQAYQIPTPRTLYSSTTILGSSSGLKPETSQTSELNANYTTKNISSWISVYYVRNRNTIIFIGNKAKNLTQRNVIGIDAYMNKFVQVSFLQKLSIWGYYSMYIKAKEDVFDAQGIKSGVEDIGDLSHHKVYLGATCYFTQNLMLNLRGRYISDRKAVSTNITNNGETRVVDAYYTMDANLMYQDLFVKGFSIALKVDNIFNKKYFHPGINKADAGTDAGYWTDDNVWHGSKGWNNSLLPQPHRYFMLSLLFNM